MTTGDAPLDVAGRGRHAVFQLLGRSVVMRAVTVLGTIALARILSPADFGVYAIILVFVLLLGMVGESGISASLVQQPDPPTDDELATAWTTQQLLGLAIVAVIWSLAAVVPAVLPGLGPDFEWQLRFASLAIPLTILRTVPIAMMTRDMGFGALATVEVVMHLAFYGVAVTGAVAGAGSWSFVIAMVAQTAAGALLVNLWWRGRLGLRFDMAIARRQLSFGLAYMSANVTMAARDAVVPIFGGLAGGVPAIGQLQFAYRIGQVVATVDDIIARIAFPAFSRLHGDPARIRQLTREAVLVAGLVVGAVQLWLVAVAPAVVPIVFGEQWIVSVPVLQLVCIGTLATVPTRLLRTLVFGQGRPGAGLLLALAGTGLTFIVFPVLVTTMGLVGGGVAFIAAGLLGLWLHVRAVRATAPFPWVDLARVYLVGAAAGGPAWLVVGWLGGAPGAIAGTVLFGVAYLVLAWVFARSDLARTWRLVRGRRPGSGPSEDSDPGAILAPDGAPPVRDPGTGAHQRSDR